MITLIWAMDLNHLIGKNNKIPWHYKEDLLYYKSVTEGKNVLMGDATYYSLKSYYKERSLPYNKIYVASLENFCAKDAMHISDVKSFLSQTKEDIFVVGGKTIYNLSMEFADRIMITLILKTFDGDTYMNNLNLTNFALIDKRISGDLLFLIYERKK